MSYRLLQAFQELFEGRRYLHRNSTRGDWVAYHLYEDLLTVGKSQLLVDRIRNREHVLNLQNRRQGVKARRGDGTFGELIPGISPTVESGFSVARGPIATVEIGVEVKILAKAMIKQIGRVTNDLRDQVAQFQRGGGTPITLGIVGVNYADYCVSYEKDRIWRTDGSSTYRHPIQEAKEAEFRLGVEAAGKFDHFFYLRYKATNEQPYPFEWLDYMETFKDYGAILTRISREYDIRFGP